MTLDYKFFGSICILFFVFGITFCYSVIKHLDEKDLTERALCSRLDDENYLFPKRWENTCLRYGIILNETERQELLSKPLNEI